MAQTAENLYVLYRPSVPIAIVAISLLLLTTAFHCYQFIRYRSWVLFWLILGAILECLGFAARAVSVTNPTKLWPYLAGYCIPIIAPSFLVASCYMVFGRTVWAATPIEKLKVRYLLVPARWITPLFVSFDLFSFFVQFIGVLSIVGTYDTDSGRTNHAQFQKAVNILKAGLVMQMICFALFAVIGIKFTLLSRKWDTQSGYSWSKLNLAVNCAATLITLRALYRIMEYSEANVSIYIETHEWCFYVFDLVPIILSLVAFNIFHPGKCLPKKFNRILLSKTPLLEEKRREAQFGKTDPFHDRYALSNDFHNEQPRYPVPAYESKGYASASNVELGRM